MTTNEVEEFLWTLSTCLEGEIGNWRIRFGGVAVSVRVDRTADRLEVSAPIASSRAPGTRAEVSGCGIRFLRRGSEVRAVFAARLSELTINGLQAGFQHVVVGAAERPIRP
jgi:hypothetical protein